MGGTLDIDGGGGSEKNYKSRQCSVAFRLLEGGGGAGEGEEPGASLVGTKACPHESTAHN